MMIIVTAHAKSRFRERFRLQFHPDTFKENRDVVMIRKLFTEAKYVDFALRMCSGKYTALCVKHGRLVRISKVRNFVFVHSEPCRDGHVTIYTMLQEGSILANIKF